MHFNNYYRLKNTKSHGLHEAEDKWAEDFMLMSRKHLFMANNLYSVYMYIKDKKKESGSSPEDAVSLIIIGITATL